MDFYGQKQGDLVTILHMHPAQHPAKGVPKKHTRGVIRKFSKNSKARLRVYLAKIRKKNLLFATATFAENITDNEYCKKQLHNFCRAVSKIDPRIWFVWKMEYQKRGAIHYHFIVGGTTYRRFYRILKKNWKHGFTHLLTAKKQHLYYFSKYIMKDVVDVPDMVGRFWGVYNKLAVDIESIVLYTLDNLQTQFYEQVFTGLRKDSYSSKINIFT